jgi:hypothetical protein
MEGPVTTPEAIGIARRAVQQAGGPGAADGLEPVATVEAEEHVVRFYAPRRHPPVPGPSLVWEVRVASRDGIVRSLIAGAP